MAEKNRRMSAESFCFKPIGYLQSCYPEKFGVPRQSGLVARAYSELNLSAEYQPEISLQGLEGYSHIWLQFVFHLNNNQRFHAKVHPPRLSGDSVGVFATRSPHRPNAIGLSLVELIELKENRLILAGADLVDGTPILDVKPYLPHIEALPQARGGWSAGLQNTEICVEFSEKAMEILQEWMKNSGRIELQEVIIQILQQDPRPVVYRGFESQESPYRNKHAFRLYDGDIHFEFLSQSHAIVFDILF
jgi:tRNA-Thr(GGU) m(6)t(6)A37 methyltransferase TsaA